jgi:hypothetical protein
MSEELQQLAEDLPPDDDQQHDEPTGDGDGLRQEEEVPETPVTVEQRARAMGWRPKSEYRGDPANFTDAAEFVRRADESLPLTRNELRRAQQKLIEQERELAAVKESAIKFAEFQREYKQRLHEQTRDHLRRLRVEARNNFDVDGELQIEDRLEQLERDYKQSIDFNERQLGRVMKGLKNDGERAHHEYEINSRYPDAEVDPEIQRQTQEWQQRNEWVNDPEAQAVAIAVGQKLRAAGEASVGSAFLEKVAHEVRKKYPQFFPTMQNPRREQAPAATGGGDAPVRGRKKGYADLPSDARAACDDFVKRGYLTKDDYVKQYFGE